MTTDPEAARPWSLRWIFLGPQGLRAGWGIAIFFLIIGAVMIPTVLTLSALGMSSAELKADGGSAMGAFKGELIGLFTVAAATFLMTLVERRPISAYGLSLKKALPLAAHGLATGVGLMALLTGLLVAAGALKIDGPALHGDEIWRQGAYWGLAFIAVGVFEELLMRGYLLATLARGLNARWAAVITSVLFGLGHVSNTGEGWVGIVSAVLIALVLAWSVFKTGSLIWAFGFHAAWDWAESYLFGLGDSGFQAKGVLLAAHPTGAPLLSGGATGPEGSVLCLLTIVAAAALVRWTLPARADVQRV